MIGELFKIHNIKYVISVDDCFHAQKREDIEATVYSQMCTSLDPFKSVLVSCGQAMVVDEIEQMQKIGQDSFQSISFMLSHMEERDLLTCYEICDKSEATYSQERDSILPFLDKLKCDGYIVDYRTFASTVEANRFDAQSAGMVDGAILWLLDQNFNRVGESDEAGLNLAENIIKRTNAEQNYVYILTAKSYFDGQKEDDIEAEFDKLLADHCESDMQSFIYYISKQRLQTKDFDKIAKSLAQGFKRKACYELFRLFYDCMNDGLSEASAKVQQIRQTTLNYLFANKASVRGEPYTEVAARLVQIFIQDEYNKIIAARHREIAAKAQYYEHLCSVISYPAGNKQALTTTLKEYRDIELYNKHINKQNCEVATGDIFKIGELYYLLVSQACDTCLRSDGSRQLEFASLLEICDSGGAKKKYSYDLSCFQSMKKPAVMYRSLKIMPFEILDLCVLNPNGQACVVLGEPESFSVMLKHCSNNYKERFMKVLEMLSTIKQSKSTIDSFLSGNSDFSAGDVNNAYNYLEKLDPNLKNYTLADSVVSFPVQRIARLNELKTIDVVKEYGIVLSRIGHPFDFSEDTTDE